MQSRRELNHFWMVKNSSALLQSLRLFPTAFNSHYMRFPIESYPFLNPLLKSLLPWAPTTSHFRSSVNCKFIYKANRKILRRVLWRISCQNSSASTLIHRLLPVAMEVGVTPELRGWNWHLPLWNFCIFSDFTIFRSDLYSRLSGDLLAETGVAFVAITIKFFYFACVMEPICCHRSFKVA